MKKLRDRIKTKENDEDLIQKLEKLQSTSDSATLIIKVIDKLKSLQKENEELNNDFNEYTDRTKDIEETLQTTINSNKKLKEDIKDYESQISRLLSQIRFLDFQTSDLNKQKDELEMKIDSAKIMPINIQEFDNKELIEELQQNLLKRKKQISELELKINSLESGIIKEKKEEITKEKDAKLIDNTLVNDLTAELSRHKALISELKNTIENINKDKEILNKELIEAKSRNSENNSIVAEKSGPNIEQKEMSSNNSPTLQTLCQDLQSDLNRYKKIIEELKNENVKLKNNQNSDSINDNSNIINDLKRENQYLKEQISELEEINRNALEEAKINPEIEDNYNKKIKELEDKLREKNNLIKEIKSTKSAAITDSKDGPMSDLIDDLQNKINKLKAALKEKNQQIEQLKK